MAKPRDYTKERLAETSLRKKKRASRNRARYIMMKKKRVRKGDGKHVDHISCNAMNNSLSNIRVISQAANLARKRK